MAEATLPRPPRALSTCGHAVTNPDGIEEACGRPGTGWRWYQDVEHEDSLGVACDHHKNEGGRRIAALTAQVAAVRAALLEGGQNAEIRWRGALAIVGDGRALVSTPAAEGGA